MIKFLQSSSVLLKTSSFSSLDYLYLREYIACVAYYNSNKIDISVIYQTYNALEMRKFEYYIYQGLNHSMLSLDHIL